MEFYKLYVSIDGGAFQILDEVEPDQTFYLHQNILDETHYEYFIRAGNQNITSTSCIQGFTSYYPDLSEFIELENVSVTEDNKVVLKLLTDTANYALGYRVMRKSS